MSFEPSARVAQKSDLTTDQWVSKKSQFQQTGGKMMAAQLSQGMDLGGRKMSRISYQHPGIDSSTSPGKSMDGRRNLTLKSRSSRRGVEPLGRSSLRSKGSSSNSGSGGKATDKVKLLKNCLRTMAEFMCAQVGVGSVMVAYTIVGASIFQVSD